MRLNLKKVIKDCFNYCKENYISILCLLNEIVIIIVISFALAYNDNNDNSSEIASTCTLEYGATTEDNMSNYVALNPLTLNFYDGTTNYQYRSSGSLFIGYNKYENNNIYLYYPIYVNGKIEYQSILLTGTEDRFLIACTQTNTTFRPVNFQCIVSWYGNDNGITGIEEIDYYSYQSSMKDISTMNNQYTGFTNESLYIFNDIDILQVYNTSNLSSAKYSYTENISYIPAIHFTDAYTYGIAYFEGAQAGYQSGYEVGYNYGAQQTLNDLTPLEVFATNFNGLMNIDIFPGFSIGSAMWLAMGVVLFGALMKVFRF